MSHHQNTPNHFGEVKLQNSIESRANSYSIQSFRMSEETLAELKALNIQPSQILEESNIFKSDQHLALIFQKLYEFYQLKLLIDFDLIVGCNAYKIETHRVVLIASSEFFLDVFTKKPYLRYLEMLEVDEVVMIGILGYMYTSTIDLEESYSVDAIMKVAVLFKMHSLGEICGAFMEENINLANCFRFARLAWEYNKPRVLRKTLTFAHEHFEKIRYEKEFFQLGPEILREFLSSDFLSVDSEEVVLHSLLDWASFDVVNRHSQLSSLLSIVRFELLSPTSITNIKARMVNIPNCMDIIFGWLACHIEYQHTQIKPLIRARNMNQTYSLLCGESIDDWNIMTYNILLDSWSCKELPNSLKKRSCFKAIVTADKRIIVSGGQINGAVTTSVECLDVQTNKWINLPAMREARLGHAMVLINGDLFVIGGMGHFTLLSVERYSFNTNTWSNVCPLPIEIAYSHRYAIVNDRLYIMNFYYPKKLMCFNPQLFEWTELDFDHDVEKGCDMVAIGDDIIACFVDSNIKSIERYSPEEDKWTKLPSDGIERFACPRIFTISNKLIFWGKARDDSQTILVEMYDPETGNFTSLTPLEKLLYDLNIK